MTTQPKVILIACGSFNPPTPMHFRMFEIARDYFRQVDNYDIIGGIISPVHDSYPKENLAAAKHRLSMIKIGLQTSDWIKLSEWETEQNEWTTTRQVLQYHQNYLNSYLTDVKGNNNNIPIWFPKGIKRGSSERVQLMLLCGADLLESFCTPGLWKEEDLIAILDRHGIVVVSRNGSNTEKIIFNSDLLSRHMNSIISVTNWVTNEISSTLIRRFIRRGLSIKYLLDDFTAEYIKKHKLYQGSNRNKYLLTPNHNSSEPMLISPSNDETLDNLQIIKKRNQKNFGISSEKQESMDETDTSKTGMVGSRKSSITGASKRDETESSDDKPSRTYINRPGGAVKISRGDTILKKNNIAASKSGGNSILSLEHTICGSLDAPDTEKEISTYDELNSDDSSTLSLSNNSRISPAKDYNEMIKFVFTEHGIRVISDKEYVV